MRYESTETFLHSASPVGVGDVCRWVDPDLVAACVQRQNAAPDDLTAAAVAVDSVGYVHLGRLQNVHSRVEDPFHPGPGCGGSDSLHPAYVPFPEPFRMSQPPNHPAAGNAALGVCLHFGHHRRGAPEPGR